MATRIDGTTPPIVNTDTSTPAGGRSEEEILRLINSIETRSFRTPGGGSLSPTQGGSFDRGNYAKLSDFESRVDAARARGDLTSAEAQSLKAQHKGVGNQILQALQNGTIDDREQKSIDSALTRLDEALNRAATNTVREKPPAAIPDFKGATTREAEFGKLDQFQARIDSSFASKALSQNEKRNMEIVKKNIGDTITRALSDGKIDEREAKNISQLMKNLSASLDREENDTERGK